MQMTVNENLIIADSCYDVQRMKRQHPQLTGYPAKQCPPERRENHPCYRLFSHNEAIIISTWLHR